TFFAELCLVQLSIGNRLICADPLGASDLSEFWSALMRCGWVVHSGRQDMEVAWQASGCLPRQVFDTQVAAALLGYAPQIGYAGLVAELFAIELAKSHTRADWSRRPLSPEALHYAAEDVEYLLPAFDLLHDRLERRGRLSWAEQDSMDLLDSTLYEVNPDTAIERVKGAKNLRGAARAIASGLAAWREKEAVRRNRPRQWILRDAVLLEIAQSRPTSRKALLAIQDVAETTVLRAGGEWLDIISSAATANSDYEPPPRPDEQQKALLKRLLQAVMACATELGISAETVTPRKELALLLEGRRNLRVLRGWRRELIGKDLLAML
ncbi:MAG: HRDC domain-containing protein, partial [Woeseiaceae bacterium]|nr:HRDC domain-containing protein [Woeseiaceae bacterium]